MHKDGYKPKISIIVPVKDEPEKTMACFASIRACTETPYEIIWVDNGSTQESKNAIRWQATRPGMHTKLVAFRHNLGFVKAINAGIKEVEDSAEYVFFLNNDTEVSYRWAAKMIAFMEKDPTIGAVGPVTQSRISWQEARNLNLRWKLNMPEWTPMTDNKVYAEMLSGGFKGQHRDVGTLPLAFFATALPRRVLTELGGLDEDFGIGLGDDDEYCFRLRAHGYKLHLALDTYVFHHHRTTFRGLGLPMDKIRRHNLGILRAKKALTMDKVNGKLT